MSTRAIQREDLRLLSYEDYGRLLEALTDNVSAACRQRGVWIDAIAPILRSGAFPACHLASRLGVLRLLPLQYKHMADGAVERLLELPRNGESRNATILLVDTNTVSGEIAGRAAADLRAVCEVGTILFASVMLDISLNEIPGIDVLISARRTNERRTLSCKAAKDARIPEDVYIFPWEDVEEQWSEIRMASESRPPNIPLLPPSARRKAL